MNHRSKEEGFREFMRANRPVPPPGPADEWERIRAVTEEAEESLRPWWHWIPAGMSAAGFAAAFYLMILGPEPTMRDHQLETYLRTTFVEFHDLEPEEITVPGEAFLALASTEPPQP